MSTTRRGQQPERITLLLALNTDFYSTTCETSSLKAAEVSPLLHALTMGDAGLPPEEEGRDKERKHKSRHRDRDGVGRLF